MLPPNIFHATLYTISMLWSSARLYYRQTELLHSFMLQAAVCKCCTIYGQWHNGALGLRDCWLVPMMSGTSWPNQHQAHLYRQEVLNAQTHFSNGTTTVITSV